MKCSYLFSILLMMLFSGCGAVSNGLFVEVVNPSSFARNKECVEIEWVELHRAMVTPDRVVVLDQRGDTIPYQVVFDESGEPQKLLLQVDVAPNGKSRYSVSRDNVAHHFESKAFGRFVPERMDDYAWENNLVAYRIYGKKLADPRTQGVDVWVKSTPRLIIDEWYARNDYHHNHGEGMDCYKVGNTLGGGALAPVVDGKLLLLGNYVSHKCLTNGPLRTMAEFEYEPQEVEQKRIKTLRRIWLDADSRFTVQEYIFSGFEGEIEVAAGIVEHDVKSRAEGKNWVAFTEAASDSKQPEVDGDISLGVVLKDGQKVMQMESHSVVVRRVKAGESVLMLNGSGWSGGGVSDPVQWQKQVQQAAERLNNPLKVEILRKKEL